MLKTEGSKQLTLMEGIFQERTKMIYNACHAIYANCKWLQSNQIKHAVTHQSM